MKKVKITNALIWAVIIMLNSYLFKESTNFYTMFFILIACCYAQISLLDYAFKKSMCEQQSADT